MMDDRLITIISALCAGAYATLLCIYLWAERQNSPTGGFRRATGIKLTLSALFCTVGVISYWYLIFAPYRSATLPTTHIWILLGLFAALPGDYFLQYIKRDTKKYIAGILCFSATQIFLILGLFFLYPPGLWGVITVIVITITVMLPLLSVMKKQNWQLGKEKNVLSAYTVLITFMTAKALQSVLFHPSLSSGVFAAGASLFLISDILLGLWNYHSGRRLHANLNWITYFTGMFLIALSILPLY